MKNLILNNNCFCYVGMKFFGFKIWWFVFMLYYIFLRSVIFFFCVRVRICIFGGCCIFFFGLIEFVILLLYKFILVVIEIIVKFWKRVIIFIWIRWFLCGVNNVVNILVVYILLKKFCEMVSYWYFFKKK